MTDFQVTGVPGTGAVLALGTLTVCTGASFRICHMLANRQNIMTDYDSNHRQAVGTGTRPRRVVRYNPQHNGS